MLAMILPAVIAVVVGITAYAWWNDDKPTAVSVRSAIVDMGDYRLFKPAKSVNKFVLQSGDNEVSLESLQGRWTFVMFGYTHCPDVCPTTLTRAKGVYPQLKSIADAQVLFVSADPLRDDATRLSKYVGYFDDEFIGATTSHDKLFPFAQNLLLPYGIIAKKVSDDYAVSHSASIALINPQGKLHAHFKPSHQLGEVPIVDMKLMANSFAEIVAKVTPD